MSNPMNPEDGDYRPRPIDTSRVELTVELAALIEVLAENAHDTWAFERMAAGWRYGPKRDDDALLHSCLVSYANLSETEKDVDRSMVVSTVRAILAHGYELRRLPAGIHDQPRGKLSNDEMRTYAWNWFAMHAGQRLQLVNFWLVAVAFLAAAFVQSQISHARPIAAGVAVIGAIASVAFQRLDVRTRQLTQIAENALRELDDEWVKQGASDAMMLVRRSHEARESWVDSYRLIIQGLQLAVALVFFAAFIYALVS
jgi:hypothetical protein